MSSAADKLRKNLPPGSKPKKAKVDRRKKGLLHGPRAVEVEPCSNRQKKVCAVCANLPAGRRLVIRTGSGVRQTMEVMCMKHGMEWLRDRREEYLRAETFLLHGELDDGVGIRL